MECPVKQSETEIPHPAYEQIVEGSTLLLIPKLIESRGPASTDMPVFYNPAMSINRDFSVLFFQSVSEIRKALDGLAATGARGIRIMNETTWEGEMHMNDFSPVAQKLMERNAELNSVDVTIHRKNLNTILSEQYFDLIDIDPFGGPVDFVPQACTSIRNRGYLAITATDTGALCGSYPKPGLRRYGFRNGRSYLTHETGVRGLLGYAIRQAAVHDRYLEPVLSQSINHYYRVVVRVINGAKIADRMLDELTYVRLLPGGFEVVSREDRDKMPRNALLSPDSISSGQGSNRLLGPFYTGPLHSHDLLNEMSSHLSSLDLVHRSRIEKLLGLYLAETPTPPWFYDSDHVASHLGRSAPAIVRILSAIQDKGYIAGPTQFSPTGFRTDAPRDIVFETFGTL
jgi:tRNA (guanine26-N2/guanine27-N2)-dimethyltransferase